MMISPSSLCEWTNIGIGQDVDHQLGWACQSDALGCHHVRPIDQDGLLKQGVEQIVLADGSPPEPLVRPPGSATAAAPGLAACRDRETARSISPNPGLIHKPAAIER